jgi:trehalose-6-phosphate synthase
MRLSLRFILPLILVLGIAAYSVIPLVDSLTLKWFSRDLDTRSRVVGSSVQETLAIYLKQNAGARIINLINRLIQDERLYAIGICDSKKRLIFKTDTFPQDILCSQAPQSHEDRTQSIKLPKGLTHVYFNPIHFDSGFLGHLVLVHDMSFIQKRSLDTKRYVFWMFMALSILISTLTVFIAQLSWRGWIKGMRSIISGKGLVKPFFHVAIPELRPVARDIRALVRDLEAERKARDEGQMAWNSRTIKEVLRRELAGDEILLVSNREPYLHTHKDSHLEVQLPASGLVTALEPIMRACGGTWIAHASGAADREVVDKKDHVRVPPDHPSYTLRRIWLSDEEVQGYYNGFSNEGIWPLCHMAHVRPIFRSEDWKQYVKVNRKFANAVVSESKTLDPIVLVQDFHLALVPRFIRQKLPDATIITFWHIPWPNPEAFGICPWRNELLDGLLGSNILGFHTRFHCNNFIDSVDRFIEARIDRDTSTISYGGKLTTVNNYPISIEWPVRWLKTQKPINECRMKVRADNGIAGDVKIGLGVDRLDYTKGVLERFNAVERFLELNPEWIGKFTFVQIAAPSRSTIDQYKNFDYQVRECAKRINARFEKSNWTPIILRIEHHEPEQVYEYYRGIDFCFVSSLHDGMNLVAKEFLAARDDEQGALILSQFAGASKELSQALIVNPYNIEQCASAIRVALEMPEYEQKDRMRTMRGLIQEFNVYRWAGRMLMDAGRIRQHYRFLDKFGETDLNVKVQQL